MVPGAGTWAGRASVGLLAALALGAANAGCEGTPLLLEAHRDLGVVPLETRLVRVDEGGRDLAAPIVLVRDHGAIAFVNDTRDRPVAIVFSGVLAVLGCSHTRGFVAEGGVTCTPEPLAPGAAASLCVHAAGEFTFRIEGLDAPVEGTLVVTAQGASPAPVSTSAGGAR